MDPAIGYFAFGLAAAVTGSFIAAKLLKVDRLWVRGDRFDLAGTIDRLVLAAERAQVSRASLATLAKSEPHPLMRLGFELVARNEPEGHIRRRLDRALARAERIDRRMHVAGHFFAGMAPTLGIAGMTGAMFMALHRLEDPTRASTGFALSLIMLVVGSTLINAFTRRIPRYNAGSVTEGLLLGGLIIEGVELLARGTSPAEVRSRLEHLTGVGLPTADRLAA